MIRFLIRLYGVLLHLYPRQFHTDFGAEMQSVFAEAVTNKSGYNSTLQFLRELGDLPGSLLSVYAAQWFQGGNMSTQNEHISPSTRWQALIGVLPFLAFGIVSMIGKMDHIYYIRGLYAEMAVYLLVLTGLLVGWIRGFPLWSYSYIGWSLLIAWWNTNARIYGVDWGYRIWIPFGITVLIALLWTRSLKPLKKMLNDIWNNWTRLSLAMFAMGAWIFMVYDEPHHLSWLLISSTEIFAWFRWSDDLKTRFDDELFHIEFGHIPADSLLGKGRALVEQLSLPWNPADGISSLLVYNGQGMAERVKQKR